jgi:hypothetical protein
VPFHPDHVTRASVGESRMPPESSHGDAARPPPAAQLGRWRVVACTRPCCTVYHIGRALVRMTVCMMLELDSGATAQGKRRSRAKPEA